jgi:hypothetical protein
MHLVFLSQAVDVYLSAETTEDEAHEAGIKSVHDRQGLSLHLTNRIKSHKFAHPETPSRLFVLRTRDHPAFSAH